MVKHNLNITVVGLGYVGLPLAVQASIKGYSVTGLDIDETTVNMINSGQSPIGDEFVGKNIGKKLFHATTNTDYINKSDITLICVPTPVKNGWEPDLEPLKKAVVSVAQNMKRGSIVIIESTINPGVSDDVVWPILFESSGFDKKDILLAHCPERINPGDSKWDVRNINRVLGANNTQALQKAYNFYTSIIDASIKKMESLKEAEAVKIMENSYRDVNIAFVNELAMSFHRMGINIENVIDGAATKPFAFLAHRPGAGVGGHCIPVDPYYLINYARGFDFDHDFLSLARRINNGMPKYTVELLQDSMNDAGMVLKNSKIAILGLAYKSNVADDRESPSYKIIKLLSAHKAEILAFDPYIKSGSTYKTLHETLTLADAIVIVTGHDEFLKITPAGLTKYGIKVVIDGRNIFRNKKDEFKKRNIVYQGIGIK